MRAPVWIRCATLALLGVALWSFTYRLGAVPLLDDPNEAEYAEVAREMVETGDWISPHLNYVVFLNKPPLTYWLIGLSDLAFGTTEFAARLPGALAALLVVLLVMRMGTWMGDAATGMLAGFVLMSTLGFLVETHEVRPDLMLTAGIVGSIAAFIRWRTVSGEKARWPLLALQVALALGVLAKGLLGFLVPVSIIAIVLTIERRFDLIRSLLRPQAWWLFLLLAAPWHVMVSLRHPGFAWDYFVNQHLLVFFDRKLPRDSEPVSLALFWGTLALRLFPWTLFAPIAVVASAGRLRTASAAPANRLLLVWVAVVLLFFSCALGRMEHYSIPVLPALALLLAMLFRDYVRARPPAFATLIAVHLFALSVVTIVGVVVLPSLIDGNTWLAPMGDLSGLARAVSGIFATAASVAAIAAIARRRAWVVPALASGVLIAVPLMHDGFARVARVDSSADMAAAIKATADDGDDVVYATPIEYQSCAGLTYYLRRRLLLLQPEGYVPPPYLVPHLNELFISADQLEGMWHERRLFFLTDPHAPRARVDGTVPEPFYIVARRRGWWALTNFPLH